ncbi:MAG: hypothetical protein RBQ93_06305 [Trichlorobacter sp.]|jgi:hypothetical protein|nr:hypothetical protein [Trichlorobacter sp.]
MNARSVKYVAVPMLFMALTMLFLSPLCCLAAHQQHEHSCPTSTLPADPVSEQSSDSNDSTYLNDGPQELLLATVKSIEPPCPANQIFNTELQLRFPAVFYSICNPPQNFA